MSTEKKEYPGVGVGSSMAPNYPGTMPGTTRPATMTVPYPAYPATAFTTPGYLPSAAANYLPASYGTHLGTHFPYGAVTPGMTAYGVHPSAVPPTYMPHIAPMYSHRPAAAAMYVPAGFDGSTRFDGHTMTVVPPPIAGVAPNAAQLAMMQGNSVLLGQQKSNYLTGASNGGYTFW